MDATELDVGPAFRLFAASLLDLGAAMAPLVLSLRDLAGALVEALAATPEGRAWLRRIDDEDDPPHVVVFADG